MNIILSTFSSWQAIHIQIGQTCFRLHWTMCISFQVRHLDPVLTTSNINICKFKARLFLAVLFRIKTSEMLRTSVKYLCSLTLLPKVTEIDAEFGCFIKMFYCAKLLFACNQNYCKLIEHLQECRQMFTNVLRRKCVN